MKITWKHAAGALGLAAAILVGGQAATARAQRDADAKSYAAQRGAGRRAGPEGLFAELNLTESQRSQLEKLREEMRAEFRPPRSGGGGTPPDFSVMRERMEAQRARMDAILTPEQRTKLRQLMAEQGPMMGGPGMAGPGFAPPADARGNRMMPPLGVGGSR